MARKLKILKLPKPTKLPKASLATLKFTHFSKLNLAIFILIFGGIGGYVLLSGHAASSGANLWVDTDGGSCTRSSTPGTYDTKTACGSLDAALAGSLDGDIILVKCGTYPAQTINTVRTSGNVTFESETDKCATFEANGAQVITIGNKVGYLTLKNFTINGLIKVDSFSGNANNNITIDNNDIDVGKKVSGPPVQYSAGSNLVISNNTIGPSCCGYNGGSGRSPEGIRIGKDNDLAASCQTQACNVTITNNLIQYAVRDCQYWPSSGYGTCPDTTCTNAVGCHMDGIHIWGMDGGNITGNRLYGVECQGIYFENVNSSLNSNINVTNNAISTITGGCSNKGVYINAIGSTDNIDNGFGGTWNIAFNSGSSYIMGPNNCTSCQSGTTFNITGNNMELMVTNRTGNNAGCGASAWGSATVNFKYNVWRPGGSGSTNQACGATDILASTPPAFVKEVVPPDIGIDLHLASGNSAANDFVPSAICTAITTVDFDGDTRPSGAACDAGADEYMPTANVWVSTTGDDTTCVRGDSTKPCATFNQAYQIAQCGDLVQIENGNYGTSAIGHSGNIGLPSGQNTDAKDCSAASNPVSFHGQSQSGVVLGSLTIGEPWVTVDNITTSSLDIEGWDSTVGCYATPVAYVTVKNSIIDANGAQANPMGMSNVQYVTLSNNSIGNVTTGETEIHASGQAGCPDSSHITLTGNTWHDFRNPGGSNDHMECLQIDALISGTANTSYTITGNRFENCGQYDLFTSGSMSDWMIANNYFDAPCSNQASTGCLSIYTLSLGSVSELVNIVGEYNTVIGYPQFSYPTGAATHSGNVWAYNIDSTGFNWSGQCGSPDAWSLTDNLDSNTSSGNGYVCAGDIAGDATFVSPGPPNYSYDLTASSAGIDVLSPCPAGTPAVDIYGTSRPQGTACDIGADEYTSSYTPPPSGGTTGGSNSGSGSSPGSGGGSSTDVPASYKPGDANHDGVVNIYDLSILLSHYSSNYQDADFDGNSIVNIIDLSILLSNYGI